MKILLRILFISLVSNYGCLADFAENEVVSDSSAAMTAMAKRLDKFDSNLDSLITFGIEGGLTEPDLLLVEQVKNRTVVYLLVCRERGAGDGDSIDTTLEYLPEFPVKEEVMKPTSSYLLPMTRIMDILKGKKFGMSMISHGVRRIDNKRLCAISSYLQISFETKQESKMFMDNILKMIFEKIPKKSTGRVTWCKTLF